MDNIPYPNQCRYILGAERERCVQIAADYLRCSRPPCRPHDPSGALAQLSRDHAGAPTAMTLAGRNIFSTRDLFAREVTRARVTVSAGVHQLHLGHIRPADLSECHRRLPHAAFLDVRRPGRQQPHWHHRPAHRRPPPHLAGPARTSVGDHGRLRPVGPPYSQVPHGRRRRNPGLAARSTHPRPPEGALAYSGPFALSRGGAGGGAGAECGLSRGCGVSRAG
jgi:hypothetical protein